MWILNNTGIKNGILKYIHIFLLGFKKSVVFSETISEEDEDDDSDVFADPLDELVDPELLEEAFDNFLDKLESLVSKMECSLTKSAKSQSFHGR